MLYVALCIYQGSQAHAQEPGDEANTRVEHCHHGDKADQALLALGYRCTGCSTCRYKQVSEINRQEYFSVSVLKPSMFWTQWKVVFTCVDSC